LTSGGHRAVDSLEGVFGENTIMIDTLGLEQATVGRKADLAQFRKILQAFADSKIVSAPTLCPLKQFPSDLNRGIPKWP
jgi:hypothetical protein